MTTPWEFESWIFAPCFFLLRFRKCIWSSQHQLPLLLLKMHWPVVYLFISMSRFFCCLSLYLPALHIMSSVIWAVELRIRVPSTEALLVPVARTFTSKLLCSGWIWIKSFCTLLAHMVATPTGSRTDLLPLTVALYSA